MLRETQTSICNKALALIGEEPISAIDDTTRKAARVCDQFFCLSLRSVFEDGKWPFATIEKPAERIFLPEYSKEQPYIYGIPCDSSLIVRVYSRDKRKTMMRSVDWDFRYIPELQTSAIVCNKDSIVSQDIEKDIDQDQQLMIEYISETVCSGAYPAMFVRCLVAQLAADICMPITHDQQRWGNMIQYATQMKSQALQQALNEDGQDKMHWIDPITMSRGW